MLGEKISHEFIGHKKELELFKRWLDDTASNAPWILFLYDALEAPEKKGGVGKTWLLRMFATIAMQQRNDIAVVMVDFFNAADRNGVEIAYRIIEGLRTAYPDWSPAAFLESIAEYFEAVEKDDMRRGVAEENKNIAKKDVGDLLTQLYGDLIHDLEALDKKLVDNRKHLLILFDTFELIEQNPIAAVLGSFHNFPYNYQFKHIGAVVAGRNAPDWHHQNWQGREQEIYCIPVTPFSPEEMVQFINENCTYIEPLQVTSDQVKALYERTEGRPILVGLVTDMLNHRIMTIDQLIATPPKDFERYIVTQINSLEEPINWVILFMAHSYHRFNPALLDWLLTHLTSIKELVGDVSTQELAENLLELSFVRQASTGDNITLHDEMRRLVNTYNWTAQEFFTDQYRREISRIVVQYYEHELAAQPNEQMYQLYTIEMIYHKLFIDINVGFNFAADRFNTALRLWQSAFARSIFQEIQKFSSKFSREQYFRMMQGEASLLRREENSAQALALYQKLEQEADKTWLASHRASIEFEKGDCYKQMSFFEEAKNCFSSSLEIETEKGNLAKAASILIQLGVISRRQGRLDEAAEYYKQSIHLNKKIKDRRGYADALNSLGTVDRLQGKTDKALQRCTASLQIRRELYKEKLASEIGVGLTLSSIGVIYLKIGELAKAQNFFENAYDIYERNKYRKGIAMIYNRFGQVALEQNNLPGALEWFKKAYRASLEVDSEEEINSLDKQGRVSVLQGQLVESIVLFEKAVLLSISIA